jgi:hypothetical protein
VDFRRAALENFACDALLPLTRPSGDHDLESKIRCERVGNLCPSFDQPVFLDRRARRYEGRDRPAFKLFEESRLFPSLAAVELDSAKRGEIVKSIYEYLNKQAYSVNLFSVPNVAVAVKNLKNLEAAAISTSGNSKNVIEAIKAAHAKGMKVIALTGKDGGAMGKMLAPGDFHLNVAHPRTMRVQEIHLLAIHSLCVVVDNVLFGEKK